MTQKTKAKKCSLCPESYYGYGHNAAPYDGRCCDLCNENIVTPTRIAYHIAEDKSKIGALIQDIRQEIQGVY